MLIERGRDSISAGNLRRFEERKRKKTSLLCLRCTHQDKKDKHVFAKCICGKTTLVTKNQFGDSTAHCQVCVALIPSFSSCVRIVTE